MQKRELKANPSVSEPPLGEASRYSAASVTRNEPSLTAAHGCVYVWVCVRTRMCILKRINEARAFNPTCILHLLKPGYKRAEAGQHRHLAVWFLQLMWAEEPQRCPV